jgi:hypothetical protein
MTPSEALEGSAAGVIPESPLSGLESIVIPALIGCATLLFLYLAGMSSIPVLGWMRLKTSVLETAVGLSFFVLPGFLVGWTSSRGRRSLPILIALTACLALTIPRMAYLWVFGIVIVPALFLLSVGLGVWARSVTHGRANTRALLSVLALLNVGVALYLWFQDGWRFIWMDSDQIARVQIKRPGRIFSPDQWDWWSGLQEATEKSFAHGDLERTRAILPKLQRAGFVCARELGNSPALAEDARLKEVAELYVAVGDQKSASGVMDKMGMPAAKRPFVFVGGHLRKGDFMAATAIADKIPDPDRTQAYYRIALTQANGGRYSEAIATITRHPGDGQLQAFEEIAEVAFRNKRPDATAAIFLVTREIIQALPSQRERDVGLAAIAQAQDYYRLFDDAEQTLAMIQDLEVRGHASTHLRDPAIWRPR